MLQLGLPGEAGFVGGLKQLLLSVFVWCRAVGSVPRLCCGRMRGVNVQTKQCWPKCLPGASVCDYRDPLGPAGAVPLALPWDE